MWFLVVNFEHWLKQGHFKAFGFQLSNCLDTNLHCEQWAWAVFPADHWCHHSIIGPVVALMYALCSRFSLIKLLLRALYLSTLHGILHVASKVNKVYIRFTATCTELFANMIIVYALVHGGKERMYLWTLDSVCILQNICKCSRVLFVSVFRPRCQSEWRKRENRNDKCWTWRQDK